MRRLLIAFAAGAALMISGLLADRANAMPLAPLAQAAEGNSAIDQVQYGCRRVWRCGPWGCGWRRICWGAPYYGYGYGYRPYYGYGYRYGYARPWGYRGYGYRGFGPRWGYRRW